VASLCIDLLLGVSEGVGEQLSLLVLDFSPGVRGLDGFCQPALQLLLKNEVIAIQFPFLALMSYNDLLSNQSYLRI
jgi:hypothetical protein